MIPDIVAAMAVLACALAVIFVCVRAIGYYLRRRW